MTHSDELRRAYLRLRDRYIEFVAQEFPRGTLNDELEDLRVALIEYDGYIAGILLQILGAEVEMRHGRPMLKLPRRSPSLPVRTSHPLKRPKQLRQQMEAFVRNDPANAAAKACLFYLRGIEELIELAEPLAARPSELS